MVRRFKPDEIEKLKLMADFGHDGKSIARTLDRTPQAIRVKCVELGIRLRKPSPDSRRIRVSPDAWRGLGVEAARRSMSPGRLARLVIETVVKDRLIDAVIDAPPHPSRRVMATRPGPKWASALRG